MNDTASRDPLLRYVHARADSADLQAALSTDPEELRARQQERRLTRLLLAMILAIVAGGFVISIVGQLIVGATSQ